MGHQIVVVIGGSSGIGYEVARQAGRQSARLIIAGRNQAKLDAAGERLGGVVQTAVGSDASEMRKNCYPGLRSQAD